MIKLMEHEAVILLHGLARTYRSMKPLEYALTQHGYNVHNMNYPSRHYSIEALAEDIIPKAVARCVEATKIHFVTHSMGGILLRHYLDQHHIDKLHRVVMLGPPNQGSEVVDQLSSWPGFAWINGKAGMQLGTSNNSVPNKLGPVNFDLGVVAGTCSINVVLSLLIPGVNDGKVSVERTKIPGMKDHIAIPVSHPFMMKNPQAIEQVIHYLTHGCFNDTYD